MAKPHNLNPGPAGSSMSGNTDMIAAPPRPSNHERKAAMPRLLRWSAVALAAVALAALAALYRGLEPFSRWFTYDLLRLHAGNHLASAVQFFVFEVPKVLMLLTVVVFGVGIVRSFFTPERTRRILAGTRESVGNVLAALLGVVTPFCS